MLDVGPDGRGRDVGRSGSAESASAKAVPFDVPFHRVAAPLLALCLGGYWASLDPDLERHFQDSTALLFLSLGWLYGVLLRGAPVT